MKKTIFLLLVLLPVLLTSCGVLEERYAAERAQSYAQAERSRAASSIAASQSIAAQAAQTTAQVAQVEATNRMMAFLAAVVTIGQGNALFMIGVVALVICAFLAILFGRQR